MEMKSVIRLEKDFELKDEGFELQFTPEEIKRFAELAEKKGVPVKQLIEETINKAVETANVQVGDKVDKALKDLEEYQRNAKAKQNEHK